MAEKLQENEGKNNSENMQKAQHIWRELFQIDYLLQQNQTKNSWSLSTSSLALFPALL